MPSAKLTQAQAQRLVASVAREIAREHGARLSAQALKQLVGPSVKYFAEHGPVSISPARLRRELAPLVAAASEKAPRKRIAGGKKGGHVATRWGPKSVRGSDIRGAMQGATCHFLWFC